MPELLPTPYSAQFNRGLVMVASNKEINERQVEAALRRAEQDQAEPEMTSLSAHIESCWQASKRAKNDIESRLLTCLRQRKGEYDSNKLAKIQEQGLAEDFAKLTDKICRGALSWLKDILLPPGEKPWALTHTPVPDLKDSIVDAVTERIKRDFETIVASHGPIVAANLDWQEIGEQLEDEFTQRIKEQAKDDAERLEKHINDELTEGSWYEAIDAFLDDLVTFPAAIIAGPVKRKKKVLQWNGDSIDSLVFRVVTSSRIMRQKLSGWGA